MDLYYKQIKEELINNEITKKVKDYSKNKSDLTTYYNVGKLLSDAGKHYGEGIIKNYSIKLKIEVSVKYETSYLNKIRNFFMLSEKVATVSPLLSFRHYVELLPLNDINEINYYINLCEKENISVRKLREKIKNKEYERLPENTKNKLITNNENDSITDYIKNPVVIHNSNNYESISEKVLQKMIMEDLENFMKELGNGFCFIGSEYKIKIGNSYNYIDLLLFNYIYNCFVVIELKITELKKEHIGQISIYMIILINI